MIHPLGILAIGIVTVIGMILVFRINAFIALITAAIVVSLLGPPAEEGTDRIKRVAEAFGSTAGSIGIVIALAAVIGKCLMDSGAADRIVRSFLGLLGEKRASYALMGSGFVLAVPVFFDTVFYLLVPLARSLYRRTNKNYLQYLLAIVAGGAITHTLVPPTPGPLVMADQLGVGLGKMIFVGAIVALPAALAGIVFAKFADRMLNVPMRKVGTDPEPEPIADDDLPPLLLSLLPVVLPVAMIGMHTFVDTFAKQESPAGLWNRLGGYTVIIGNPNLALLVSTAIAIVMLKTQRKLALIELSEVVESSLMSGGAIILITAGGGAFGGMLKIVGIREAILDAFQSTQVTGLFFLFLGFGIAAMLKVAQGSSTVAMITGSGMLAAMVTSPAEIGFDPVYLATAIGAGSLIGSWMNDSGFWIFTKMGGLTEAEGLKSWTPLLIVLGVVSMAVTVVLAMVLPLV